MNKTLIAAAALSGLFLACGDSAQKDALEEAQELWAASPMGDEYTYVWQQTCFCDRATTDPIAVTVVQGTIISATYTADGQEVPASVRSGLLTIEEIFARIDEVLGEADEVVVTYDQDNGHPVSFSVDFERRLGDDEFTINISEVLQLVTDD